MLKQVSEYLYVYILYIHIYVVDFALRIFKTFTVNVNDNDPASRTRLRFEQNIASNYRHIITWTAQNRYIWHLHKQSD